MTQHDYRVRLRHMLAHSREAVQMVKGVQREDLDRDRKLELALTRLVEIVGEAASKVDHAHRAQFPGIPWQAVVGMRQRLVHGYDVVDLQVLWDTITDDLPPLIAELEGILESGGDPASEQGRR
jgi:uncharacterized protein with HEPN domain